MITKAETLAAANAGAGCLGKADDDEPVFVLRAQDRFARDLVEQWARWVEGVNNGVSTSKVHAARAVAAAMDEWQRDSETKYPD